MRSFSEIQTTAVLPPENRDASEQCDDVERLLTSWWPNFSKTDKVVLDLPFLDFDAAAVCSKTDGVDLLFFDFDDILGCLVADDVRVDVCSDLLGNISSSNSCSKLLCQL